LSRVEAAPAVTVAAEDAAGADAQALMAALSQALAAAFAILLVGNPKATGGSTGLNNFRGFFGFNLYDPVNKQMLFFIASGALLAMVALVRQLMVSRYGELLVACRDAEERVRFLGYDPANVKLIAFVAAAIMASIGGAMFAPIAGIISPSNVDATASIMLLAGVALGGRASLLGPALGAIAVGYGQSTLSEAFPTNWVYFQGALFIVVMLLLPGGIASLWTKGKNLFANRSARVTAPPRATTPALEAEVVT